LISYDAVPDELLAPSAISSAIERKNPKLAVLKAPRQARLETDSGGFPEHSPRRVIDREHDSLGPDFKALEYRDGGPPAALITDRYRAPPHPLQLRALLVDPRTHFVWEERLTCDRAGDIANAQALDNASPRSAPSARSIAVRASSMSIHADGTTNW
jgi:hypothetical protein